MPYVIGAACIDELSGDCVDACPVDCIYEGARKRYISPAECIECGACLPACPVQAISNGRAGAPPEWAADNKRFFDEPLPGRDGPLGSPGGASGLGPLRVDTELVSAAPPKSLDNP
jgi:NAD-dependent dihydropyrimidine dehydrogenase PreA subunit